MTGILLFESRHGQIAVEVDENVARAVGSIGDAGGDSGGGDNDSGNGGGDNGNGGGDSGGRDIPEGSQLSTADVVAKAPRTFSEAMASLKAYAGALEDLIMGLDIKPSEVSVQIGLKLTGAAGFVIAKAGAESEMKVSLKWEPKKAGKPVA